MLRSLVTRVALPALCALSVVSSAHAGGLPGGVVGSGSVTRAANPQPVAQATASQPGALVWVDTDKGTGLDGKAADPYRAQFEGSQWTLLDNNLLAVTKGGKTILTVVWVANKEGTFVPLHGRSGSLTIDGTIYRNEKDMSQGAGELYINMLAQDGKSARSIRIAVDLTFAGGGGNQPAPDDGGFGGF